MNQSNEEMKSTCLCLVPHHLPVSVASEVSQREPSGSFLIYNILLHHAQGHPLKAAMIAFFFPSFLFQMVPDTSTSTSAMSLSVLWPL
jgi:hypothetical protein